MGKLRVRPENTFHAEYKTKMYWTLKIKLLFCLGLIFSVSVRNWMLVWFTLSSSTFPFVFIFISYWNQSFTKSINWKWKNLIFRNSSFFFLQIPLMSSKVVKIIRHAVNTADFLSLKNVTQTKLNHTSIYFTGNSFYNTKSNLKLH